MEDLIYTLSLTRVKTITAADMRKLMDRFPKSADIFSSDRQTLISCLEPRRDVAAISELILRFNDFDWAKKEIENAEKLGISLISYREQDYPHSLKFIPDPPPILYVTGKVLPCDTVSLAIVGTRSATSYGIMATCKIVRQLVAYKMTIVSGLARGIDSVAHREAIAAKGRTIAVMASGADITYPPENIKLRKQIEENGAVITEYPIGSPPDKWRFPARNRIISGLSLGCLVVEAPEKSGALITARLAREYNREVFAVPGNITSRVSAGCNRLIRDGAKPVTCAEDIIEEFDIEFEKTELSTPDPAILTAEESQVLSAIDDDGTIGEMIVQKIDLPAFKVNPLLVQLELKGFVKRLPGNLYLRR